MKNTTKAMMLFVGLSISLTSFAGVGQFENEKTTCYVLKNNQLVKKATCTYAGSSGGAASGYAIFESTFNIKGYGEIEIIDNWFAEQDEQGDWINEEKITTINGEQATYQNRDIKTLKILSDKQAEAISPTRQLTCYTNLSGSNELCYIDNTPR